MQKLKKVIPLRQRPLDCLFIICFSFFVCSSVFVSPFNALNIPLTPDSNNFIVRDLYWYASTIDPLYMVNPLYRQIQDFIDTFIFGPFYFLLIYALIKGKNWIRIPTIIYVSAITYSLILYFGVEFLGDQTPIDYPKFFAINLPYLLIPLALGYRMRHPYPFSNTDCAKD